jgi:hypothetical protein
VLLISGICRNRDRTRLQLIDELQQVSAIAFRATLVLLAQALHQQATYASADEPIGQQVALQQVVEALG